MAGAMPQGHRSWITSPARSFFALSVHSACRSDQMADYDLYYWPVPFRGQFIRAILAFAGISWVEHDAEDIGKLMATNPADQPVPFTGPPVLIEKATGFALAQMPAIALYLGQTLELIPG